MIKSIGDRAMPGQTLRRLRTPWKELRPHACRYLEHRAEEDGRKMGGRLRQGHWHQQAEVLSGEQADGALKCQGAVKSDVSIKLEDQIGSKGLWYTAVRCL
jgi:hypothetical protein